MNFCSQKEIDIHNSINELRDIIYKIKEKHEVEINILKKEINNHKEEITLLKKNKYTKPTNKPTSVICKELNETIKGGVQYSKWVNNININQTHVEKLFNTTIREFFQIVMSEYIDESDEHPFISYKNEIKLKTQSNYRLFVYNNEWGIIENDEISKMIDKIQTLTLEECLKWETNLGDNIKEDSNVTKMLNSNMKLLGINTALESKHLKTFLTTKIQQIN